MKKSIVVLTLVMAILMALGITSVVSADSTTPTPPIQSCGFFDNLLHQHGCSFNRTDRGVRVDDGILDNYMVRLLSQETNVSEANIQTRLANGETMADIAISAGMTQTEFFTWMQEARIKAVEQAVSDGVITAEQGEWMNSRGTMMFGGNAGSWGGARGTMPNGGTGRFGSQDCTIQP